MIPGLKRHQPESVTLQVRRVLIVDEALPIRRKLLDILHRTGVPVGEIHMADSVESAMETFAREHPSLVFTELVGAGSEGLDMMLEMLALDPHVKLVLITAEDPTSPLVRQAIRAGVFAVLQKPLRQEAIRGLLSEIESEEGGIERFR